METDPVLGLPSTLLNLTFGGRSVGENLHAALASGKLIRLEDGRWSLPESEGNTRGNWLFLTPIRVARPSCRFLFDFLFEVVYGQAAIPMGCRDCYKVKACPTDFKGVLALRRLSRAVPCNSKCGPEVNHFHSQDLYGGFFYCQGLEHARAIHRQVREAIDQDPALGPAVAMRIKRGCTPYEIHCGPSDRWEFQDAQVELEARLLERFAQPRKEKPDEEYVTLMQWVKVAYSIGDNSYLEFTRGRRLYPATVSYEP